MNVMMCLIREDGRKPVSEGINVYDFDYICVGLQQCTRYINSCISLKKTDVIRGHGLRGAS